MTPHPLRARQRPSFETAGRPLALVDLFAGCGGLTLGVAQGAMAHGRSLAIPLAADTDEAARNVYLANFPGASTRSTPVESIFDGDLGAPLTISEVGALESIREPDMLVGGPPCQGHSNLNNHTRRDDPKNALYLRMARAAEVLRPRTVLIENVPSVIHDSRGVVPTATKHLERCGYVTADAVVHLESLGVPQRRKRHILLAVAEDLVDPSLLRRILEPEVPTHHDLWWAIGDLRAKAGLSTFDTAPKPSADNLRRMLWLLEKDEYDLPNWQRPTCHQDDHSYKSMYGRLRWELPAQTITSGFGSIGQGRYMHPDEPRALTPHEAARLQGFPDYFDFRSAGTRTRMAVIIGNAVPPQLAERVTSGLLAARVFDGFGANRRATA